MGLRAQSLLGEGDLLGRVERGAGLGETPPLNPTQVLGRRRFDGLAAVAWVHFLALDLFVGRWVYLDARARGLTPWLTSPLLFLTLMLGPAGLLGHLLVRGRYRAVAT